MLLKMTHSRTAVGRCCDELLALFVQFVELGGKPREVLDRPLCLFEIDGLAAVGACDGIPIYKPAHGYLELRATLRTLVAEREKQQIEITLTLPPRT